MIHQLARQQVQGGAEESGAGGVPPLHLVQHAVPGGGERLDQLRQAVRPLAQLHRQPHQRQGQHAPRRQQQQGGHQPGGEAPRHFHSPPDLLYRRLHHGAQGQGQQEGQQRRQQPFEEHHRPSQPQQGGNCPL